MRRSRRAPAPLARSSALLIRRSPGSVTEKETLAGSGRDIAAREAGAREDVQALTSATVARLPELQGDVEALLDWAVEVGAWAPHPGGGETAELWELLANTAATDLSAARALEPHLDALAILAQADENIPLDVIDADATSTWGVFAAELPDHRVTASADGGAWRLDGSKAWCSLATQLSHALVSATNESGERQLFAVDLRCDEVEAASGPWHPRGLTAIVSAPVSFDSARAIAIGEPGWYLTRPGFAWGGMGVAACWWGGATAIAATMFQAAQARTPDQLAQAQLGQADTRLNAARAVLSEAAAAVDSRVLSRNEFSIEALRTRNVVANAVEEVIRLSAHSLGPAPLAIDEAHARRVADLELYVRQHHAERDDAALGRALLDSGVAPW
jgi:alkylation response protein AidB-like acyl-CoA dehydrogenase